jgi:DNA-binding CsgD family transcriptional regulator
MPNALNQQNLSSLINTIYAAGSNPSKWQDFIQQLHGFFPRGPTVLYGHDARVDRYLGMVHDGFSDEDVRRFLQHFAAVSPFTKPIAKSPVLRSLRTRDMCAEEDLRKTEYFNDFMLPRQGGGGAAIVLYRQHTRSLFLTCECDVRQGDHIEPQIVEAMTLLSGHVMQSFDMMRRLSGQKIDRSNVERLINLVNDAAIVVDAQRRILTINLKANTLFKTEKTLRSTYGELTFVDGASQAFFLKSISDIVNATLDQFTSTHVLYGDDGRKLVTLCPLAQESGFESNIIYDVIAETHPFAVVVITDIDLQENANMALASRLFGLTSAESKLAAALAAGHDLQHYAETNGVSVHTVRNQLKSIFAKTDTSRQVELALLINKISNAALQSKTSE